MNVRTRIAPSPTGFLHLGTARTALYSWAYARHFGGQFVLRIEDTDVQRSTQESVDQILDAMKWLGLEYDEGPFYQTQRLERYHAVIAQMLAEGTAYQCYCTPEELDAMREEQRARGEKTRYDGRWRPEPGKVLPPVPEGVKPVVRFRNPQQGMVAWDDLVKGPIMISNTEIDDLIILRPDGMPTYNFAVVIDDWDMKITHVFRGDEHINNTPWQINIFRALGAPLPRFGHCPIILGDDGLKLSKRRGAVSVTAYQEMGYLPEAMLNYLARLGWSHGDEELFSSEQMVRWFDGSHLAKSPAQWDPAKLAWVNAHYMKQADDARLAGLVQQQLATRGVTAGDLDRLTRAAALFKDRCTTVVELADWTEMLYVPVTPRDEDLQTYVTDAVKPAIRALRERLAEIDLDKATIAQAMKQVLADHQLKMPQLAPALRVLVCGRPQTPSIDAVLALFERKILLERLQSI
ncbi:MULTISPECIES: glutamate--tRNA ligase [Rubrivivax]|uniref:Glutamate--tRNA ligase n=1 Tax=Rubrivivax benzoatilyticus TaxID=316997 RepID=A0ABX0HUR5_9BURK|nr:MULTISPECIES: glutamate--tRNA ligase [Rubrivivax]EGJ08855.1 glutamyL-tRNA synthetase [Rubrivivax benzoatilyticus JA2 = ATCC BAA-35]MCD0418027.1 glutamate--tRNA ligase [Rubrivivax sp. JA1024]NHK97361.1 glutamate--tRNA ligase [Rubrivivax benzoatilyticus]NHL22944.1 glutamate--tRNA ligase [Rubrivivax benzoatilyticus]